MRFKWLIVLGVFLGLILGLGVQVRAEVDCSGLSGEPLYSCLGRQISELEKSLEMSRAATAPLEEEVNRLDARVKSIQGQISAAIKRGKVLEEDIKKREEKMAEQYVVLSKKTREFYKRLRGQSMLVVILSGTGSGNLNRELAYRSEANDRDRQIIVRLSQEVIGIEQDKENLEKEKERLGGLQASLDKQADSLKEVIGEAKSYQTNLTSKIAQLSSRQKSILAEKQETFQTTVGDVPLADDPASRPDYNPGFSPAWAAFSFGAPHFKGMSQYGAYGRAKAGQNYETILKAYYGNVRIETVETNFSLPTTVGSLPFEDNYMRGIAEMPSSWAGKGGMEALKAQAIAARSYALGYTGWRMGSRTPKKAICVTEACQVYRSSKVGDGTWAEAVSQTRGKILVSNGSGEVVNAWYASTSGGYQESYSSLGHATPGFWDTPSGRGGWTSEAYEKQAESPWFYKGWYRSRSGDACGRSHPWLTGEEMADILNAWVVLIKNGQSDDRVVPVGPCWGGNPYSIEELRNKGGGYGEVRGVSVTYSDGGYTAEARFETDKGSVSIGGSEFKKAFNLRAPGRVALKSGLFNIEKK